MKRSPLRKKGKTKQSVIERAIWQECRRIANIRFPATCYTCNATNLEGANKQLGHMWAKASLGAYLRYDMRVLRWQCFRCNIHMGGMGADFYKKMLKEIGEEAMAQLERDRQVTVKAYDFYVELLAKYRNLT